MIPIFLWLTIMLPEPIEPTYDYGWSPDDIALPDWVENFQQSFEIYYPFIIEEPIVQEKKKSSSNKNIPVEIEPDKKDKKPKKDKPEKDKKPKK